MQLCAAKNRTNSSHMKPISRENPERISGAPEIKDLITGE